MNGLFMKDILIIKNRYNNLQKILVVAILVGVYFVFPEYITLYAPLLLPAMGVGFLADLASADDRSGWKNYLPALPLTRKEIVVSRYIFGDLIIAATLLFSFVFSYLAVLLFGHWTVKEILLFSFGGLLISLLMLIVAVPTGYFFKGEATTGSMMIVVILVMILRQTEITSALLSGGYWVTAVILLVIMLILIYVSYRLSLLVYTQKIRLNIKRNTNLKKVK